MGQIGPPQLTNRNRLQYLTSDHFESGMTRNVNIAHYLTHSYETRGVLPQSLAAATTRWRLSSLTPHKTIFGLDTGIVPVSFVTSSHRSSNPFLGAYQDASALYNTSSLIDAKFNGSGDSLAVAGRDGVISVLDYKGLLMLSDCRVISQEGLARPCDLKLIGKRCRRVDWQCGRRCEVVAWVPQYPSHLICGYSNSSIVNLFDVSVISQRSSVATGSTLPSDSGQNGNSSGRHAIGEEEESGGVLDVCSLPQLGRYVIAAGDRVGAVRIWDLKARKTSVDRCVLRHPIGSFDYGSYGDKSPVRALGVSAGVGHVLFVGTDDGRILVWDMRSGPHVLHTIRMSPLVYPRKESSFRIAVSALRTCDDAENSLGFQLSDGTVGTVKISSLTIQHLIQPISTNEDGANRMESTVTDANLLPRMNDPRDEVPVRSLPSSTRLKPCFWRSHTMAYSLGDSRLCFADIDARRPSVTFDGMKRWSLALTMPQGLHIMAVTGHHTLPQLVVLLSNDTLSIVDTIGKSRRRDRVLWSKTVYSKPVARRGLVGGLFTSPFMPINIQSTLSPELSLKEKDDCKQNTGDGNNVIETARRQDAKINISICESTTKRYFYLPPSVPSLPKTRDSGCILAIESPEAIENHHKKMEAVKKMRESRILPWRNVNSECEDNDEKHDIDDANREQEDVRQGDVIMEVVPPKHPIPTKTETDLPESMTSPQETTSMSELRQELLKVITRKVRSYQGKTRLKLKRKIKVDNPSELSTEGESLEEYAGVAVSSIIGNLEVRYLEIHIQTALQSLINDGLVYNTSDEHHVLPSVDGETEQ